MPKLYVVARGLSSPKHAGRVIVDSNVLAVVLRHMIGVRRSFPDDEDFEGLRWIQSSRLSQKMRPRAQGQDGGQHVDFGYALIELSRNRGHVDIDRFCRFIECAELLYTWVDQSIPVKSRVSAQRPLLQPKVRHAVDTTEVDNRDHANATVALLEMFRLDRAREAGEFNSLNAALDALRRWEEAIRYSGMLTAEIAHAAIYTALGGYSAPLVAICKFSQYKNREVALSLAWNAAWDFQFLNLIRSSSIGVGAYAGDARFTAFLTYDKALAAATETIQTLNGTYGGVTGAFAEVDPQWFRRNVRSVESALPRLQEWQRQVTSLQRKRVREAGQAALWTLDEAQERRDQLLDEFFPISEPSRRAEASGATSDHLDSS